MLIKTYGTVLVFRIYGLVCAVFLLLFILVNFFNRNEGSFSADLPDDIDPKNVNESITFFENFASFFNAVG